MSLEGASPRQVDAALDACRKYGIDATVMTSASFDPGRHVEVLRVSDGGSRDGMATLEMARHVSDRDSWTPNTVTRADGKAELAVNLAGLAGPHAVLAAKKMLDLLGVPCAVVHSRSLGGKDVVRVAQADIGLLKSVVHGLGTPPVPPYPSATHVHAVGSDGLVVVRLKCPDGNGKVDNPSGPAIVGHKGSRYALDGAVMGFAEWSADARVAGNAVSASAPAPGSRP